MDIEVEDVIGEGGILSEHFDDYEFRPSQLKMAEKIHKYIQSNDIYVSEAETGIGKSFAYLIPAILSGQKTIVSTGTKNLQDQLLDKDLPFLDSILPIDFDYSVLKGWSNYLCLKEFNQLKEGDGQETLDSHIESNIYEIEKWIEQTDSGDIQNGPVNPNHPIWSDLTIPTIQCTQDSCKYYDKCFAQNARAEAEKANIIIVNHHLFLIDRYIRYISSGNAYVLPDASTVIFDEAHHLEDTITSCMSHEFGEDQISQLKQVVVSTYRDNGLPLDNIINEVNKFEEESYALLEILSLPRSQEKQRIDEFFENNSSTKENFIEQCNSIKEAISDLLRSIDKSKTIPKEEKQDVNRQVHRHKRTINNLIGWHSLSQCVYFEENDDYHKLTSAPINTDTVFNKYVLGDEDQGLHQSFVFTSATLSANNEVKSFGQKIGLQHQEGNRKIRGSMFESSFNYRDQCQLFVPEDIVEPNNHEFARECGTYMKALINKVSGGSLLLFTSYQNLENVYDRLSLELDRVSLKQGEDSKSDLIERFKSEDDPVLMATKSFWEGVDIPGDDLQLVAIDKIPFPHFKDPIFQSKSDYLEDKGKSPFASHSLPKAAIDLRQGVGRLIRSKSDEGIIAILDKRIHTKRYGQFFLNSIPNMPATSSLSDIKKV